nr:MAG: hypothetical protein DIU78_08350 [Pseudomonadota bacterium]
MRDDRLVIPRHSTWIPHLRAKREFENSLRSLPCATLPAEVKSATGAFQPFSSRSRLSTRSRDLTRT